MTHPALTEAALDTLALNLHSVGFAVIESFLETTHFETLVDRVRRAPLASARIGQAQAPTLAPSVRSDQIQWLDSLSKNRAERRYLSALQTMMLGLNCRLWLNASEIEAHYARFGPGQGYARHRDAHALDNRRVVSTIFYLNSIWPADQGGELKLHPAGADPVLILPKPNRIVVLMSETLEHEVLAPLRERFSIAGWLRRRR